MFWLKLVNLVILMKKKFTMPFHQKKKSMKLTKVILQLEAMGINGVPFFEINNKTYISGAQSSANLIEAIKANL